MAYKVDASTGRRPMKRSVLLSRFNRFTEFGQRQTRQKALVGCLTPALRGAARGSVFICVQHKRAERRPQDYHLPVCAGRGSAARKVIGGSPDRIAAMRPRRLRRQRESPARRASRGGALPAHDTKRRSGSARRLVAPIARAPPFHRHRPGRFQSALHHRQTTRPMTLTRPCSFNTLPVVRLDIRH